MSRTPFAGLEHFARVVMERFNADGGVTVETIVNARAIDWNASPPRIVWKPSRDRFGAPQKVARNQNGHSLITRHAGALVHVWGAASDDGTVTSIAATELLVLRLARALLKTGGPEPFLSLDGGAWAENPGQNSLGDAYVLSIATAIDVPDLTVPIARPTSAVVQPPDSVDS